MLTRNWFVMLFSLLLLQTVAWGQRENFSIGPRLGVNFANISNIEGSKANTGLIFGLTSTYSISEASGISVDLLYTQQGFESSRDEKVDLNYLQIPIHFNLFLGQLGEKVRPKIYAGIAPGFLLGAENEGQDISDNLNSVVFSFTGGLGFNYRLSNRVWLNVDLRSLLGLNDIRVEELQLGDKQAFRDVQLSLGVSVGLSKL